jgi:hypothetical protein
MNKVSISIHKHPLVLKGKSDLTWFCDSVDFAPDNKCLSGHKSKEYKKRDEFQYSCSHPFCNKTFCTRCVEKYKTSGDTNRLKFFFMVLKIIFLSLFSPLSLLEFLLKAQNESKCKFRIFYAKDARLGGSF